MRGSWTSSGLSRSKEENNSKMHVLRQLARTEGSPMSPGVPGLPLLLALRAMDHALISQGFIYAVKASGPEDSYGGFSSLTVGILFCFNTHAL